MKIALLLKFELDSGLKISRSDNPKISQYFIYIYVSSIAPAENTFSSYIGPSAVRVTKIKIFFNILTSNASNLLREIVTLCIHYNIMETIFLRVSVNVNKSEHI